MSLVFIVHALLALCMYVHWYCLQLAKPIFEEVNGKLSITGCCSSITPYISVDLRLLVVGCDHCLF